MSSPTPVSPAPDDQAHFSDVTQDFDESILNASEADEEIDPNENEIDHELELELELEDESEEFEFEDIPHDNDYNKLFQRYQERFNKVLAKSNSLFEAEKAQRQTLHYFHRRNNALLNLVEEYDKVNGSGIDGTEDFQFDNSRVEKLLQRVPRLHSSLIPIFELQNGNEKLAIDKNHLINLHLSEIIPDLINDDLSTIEINPQDTASWTRRNYPNLITTKFKPIKLPAKGFAYEYADPKVNINFPEDPTKDEDEINGRKRKGTYLDALIKRKVRKEA